MTESKGSRINIRLSDTNVALLRQAASASRQTVTEFLTDSAVDRAHEVLADQQQFVLDPSSWVDFVASLDAPAEPDPKLVELFSRPGRIER